MTFLQLGRSLEFADNNDGGNDYEYEDFDDHDDDQDDDGKT